MAPASTSRLTELLDQLRLELETQSRAAAEWEHQLTSQLHEMEMIQQRIMQLEKAQAKMRQEHESQVRVLQHELQSRVVPTASAQHTGTCPVPVPPPAPGHGPSNLFGEISTIQGACDTSLACPTSQHGAHFQSLFEGYEQGQTEKGYRPPPPLTASPGNGKQAYPPPGLVTAQRIQPLASHDHPRHMLSDCSPDDLPASHKKEGNGWYAVFNPEVQRMLDIELVHDLANDSVACSVCFSHDGKYLATGSNRLAQIFDVTTGQKVATFQDDTFNNKNDDIYIRSLCFSPDGTYLATGAEDKKVRVWDISARTIKHTFAGHEQDIYSLAFAGIGRYVASGSGDKTVRLWDVILGKLVYTFNINDGVTAVTMSPDGQYVAAGSLDMCVYIWDTTTGNLVERLYGPDGHQDSVYCVAFAPDGKHLVSGSLDKTIKLWELTKSRGPYPRIGPQDGKCVRTLKGHKDFVLTVCWTPDGQWIMSGSKDRGLQFWDPTTGNAQVMLQGHENSVLSVASSRANALFATGGGDRHARIWRYTAYAGQ